MEGIYTYIWRVKYTCNGAWSSSEKTKYFKTIEAAQGFVDNYSNISNGPPSNYVDNNLTLIAEKQLAIIIENETYVIGSAIKYE